MPTTKNYSLILEKFGKPIEVLKKQCSDIGPVDGNSIRVKILAAPINHADIAQIYGVYPLKIELNSVPGNEGYSLIFLNYNRGRNSRGCGRTSQEHEAR